jgi:hypothetical protein
MTLSREDVDNYLKNCGAVTWGTSFTVTSDDTRAKAVDWFMKQIEKIEATKQLDELDPNKRIELYTPTGSIRLQLTVTEILDSFVPWDKSEHCVSYVWSSAYGIGFKIVDGSIVNKEDLIMALKLSDRLEVIKWP